MAARSGGSIGFGITVTLLGVLSLGLFVTTIIFLSKYQNADKLLQDQRRTEAEIVKPDERNSDIVVRLKDAAKKDGGKSLVGFLTESMRTVNTRVTGSPSDAPETLFTKIDALAVGADGQPTGGSLSDVIGGLRSEVKGLNDKVALSEKDRQAALDNLRIESERIASLTASHQKALDAANAEIKRYRDEVETYRGGVNRAKGDYEGGLDKAKAEFATQEARLADRIKKLEAENLQLIDRVSKLQADKSKDILKPQGEQSLVDGNVISLDSGANTVTIDRGRKDKVFLGMTFAVYNDATAIKPDAATGEYPKGKATLEVINVSETSSTARVTSEVRGNPVVRGDVIANALYDPRKVYTFLVYGNFDVNGDGRATAAEADQIRALIEGWGGKVVSDLSGNVDFLVLGQRPQVPPKPGAGQPIAVVQEFIRLDQAAQRYDTLFQQASATSIPVLNENRLYTLIGKVR